MHDEQDFERQVSATIIKLRQRSPFFSTLALFAKIVPTYGWLTTAATNGRDIFINPIFWQQLRPAERLGLMAHEVLHCALLHVPREGKRDHLRWNIAADIVVNGMILNESGFSLPEGHIREKSLEHLSVEEVYHKIRVFPALYQTLQLIYVDLLPDPEGELTVAQYAYLEQYWRQALQEARTLVEVFGHGTIPVGLERELTHLNPAQLDWRAYLWRFMVQTPVDFQGFDRRFIGQDLYLDALEGERVRVFIAVDTSGSVQSQEIAHFLGEVQAILSSYPHLEAVLYYADAACYGPYELTAQSELPKPQGGGGTDFRPFFQLVEAEQDVGVCIYLTDGYGSFPAQAPTPSVLWVLSAGGINLNNVPFGEAVRLIP